ncbi:hypothetical protein AWZ03_012726 [Drosophila navojoa]|uniref:Uncharacterized protein n=1 Tax=Drosophila navojoa TaxID=7232 RepID=A0A484AWR8_DRONA|nr:uncharacterized protein LOC108656598 [Drosophila navojoa]TDG40844.1 hypothetical protein AWZ03_012726 [Drosophila navojoa]
MPDQYQPAPPAAVAPHLNPWEVNPYTDEQNRAMWRSWAQSLTRTRCKASALHYFDKSINDQDPNRYVALCMRSRFNRSIANAAQALKDSYRAAEAAPGNPYVNLQVADALYDLNRFEENKIALHNNSLIAKGTKRMSFQRRLMVVNGNFQDSVGASLGPFFLKNLARLTRIYEVTLRPERMRPTNTRWRALKDLNECDVNSHKERKSIRISPMETARRKRKMKIYNQNYLNGSWIDVAFLKALRHNPIVLMDKYYKSAKERREYLNNSYACTKRFIKMLHSRSPMYNEQYQRLSNPRVMDRLHQANLFRIQFQARRSMISILRTIREIREQKDVQRLRKFVAKIMGEFVVLKTKAVMPWKIEFMNEVYNHLALSLCEVFNIPNYKVSPYDNDSMCRLLGVNPFRPSEVHQVVFGRRPSYVYDETMPVSEQVRAFKVARATLDRRLYFSKLPIERSYLLFEIADCLLQQNHLVQCLLYAKRSIDEARRANSKIWEFLATMMQAKAHAILCKYERQSEVLNSAYRLAKDLKSPKLCTFIELCRMLNKDYMILRKMAPPLTTRRLRYRASNRLSTVG